LESFRKFDESKGIEFLSGVLSMIHRGIVKWFNDAKGFGFINNEKGDVFVHYSVIQAEGFKTLKDGEEVQYELSEGPKGLNATKVIRLSAKNVDQATASIQGLASLIEKEVVPSSNDELQTSTQIESSPELKISE
jgi:CspA family cold shock protein